MCTSQNRSVNEYVSISSNDDGDDYMSVHFSTFLWSPLPELIFNKLVVVVLISVTEWAPL